MRDQSAVYGQVILWRRKLAASEEAEIVWTILKYFSAFFFENIKILPFLEHSSFLIRLDLPLYRFR